MTTAAPLTSVGQRRGRLSEKQPAEWCGGRAERDTTSGSRLLSCAPIRTRGAVERAPVPAVTRRGWHVSELCVPAPANSSVSE